MAKPFDGLRDLRYPNRHTEASGCLVIGLPERRIQGNRAVVAAIKIAWLPAATVSGGNANRAIVNKGSEIVVAGLL